MHPRFFDRQALTACWREGLLAQSVISKTSGGYSNHPQLMRFRECAEPLVALGAYLHGVVDEADARGYNFARVKIIGDGRVQAGLEAAHQAEAPQVDAASTAPDVAHATQRIKLTEGQLVYEWQHLRAKLALRTPERLTMLDAQLSPVAHPLFSVVPGPIASWERPQSTPHVV